MPRYDAYHETVRNALVKDGWTITDDPYKVKYEDVNLYADLGAEKVLAAQKGKRKIAVEIKVFGGLSRFSELEKAIGQYRIYSLFIGRTDPARQVVMAISADIYGSFFQRPAVKAIVEAEHFKLLVFDEEREEIVTWIN